MRPAEELEAGEELRGLAPPRRSRATPAADVGDGDDTESEFAIPG